MPGSVLPPRRFPCLRSTNIWKIPFPRKYISHMQGWPRHTSMRRSICFAAHRTTPRNGSVPNARWPVKGNRPAVVPTSSQKTQTSSRYVPRHQVYRPRSPLPGSNAPRNADRIWGTDARGRQLACGHKPGRNPFGRTAG